MHGCSMLPPSGECARNLGTKPYQFLLALQTPPTACGGPIMATAVAAEAAVAAQLRLHLPACPPCSSGTLFSQGTRRFRTS